MSEEKVSNPDVLLRVCFTGSFHNEDSGAQRATRRRLPERNQAHSAVEPLPAPELTQTSAASVTSDAQQEATGKLLCRRTDSAEPPNLPEQKPLAAAG